MKLRKALFLIVVVTLWLAGGCGPRGTANTENAKKVPDPSNDARRVEAIEVFPRSIAYTVSAVGSLRTPENITISPKKAGIIEQIFVREGDRVRRGQTLVQLEDVDARLQVERAEARVRETEASLESDITTLSRYEKLLGRKVISQQTYDDLSLKVKLDEARVALAKTELNLARQNLSDHRIVSPIEGVVSLKIASSGEHVNVAPKDEILMIVQMDPLELEFFVPEVWAAKVESGDKIEFSVKAFSGEKFSATLRFISPTADPSTRNVKMKALVRNPAYRLKPGFFTEVSVQTGSNPNAIVVPESALVSQEGRFFVFTAQDGTARRNEVETGLRFDGKVEVLKGVRKGDRVVTAGHEQLSDGTRVAISTK